MSIKGISKHIDEPTPCPASEGERNSEQNWDPGDWDSPQFLPSNKLTDYRGGGTESIGYYYKWVYYLTIIFHCQGLPVGLAKKKVDLRSRTPG